MQVLAVLAILKGGGRKRVSPFKMGNKESCLEGEGQHKFWTYAFLIV